MTPNISGDDDDEELKSYLCDDDVDLQAALTASVEDVCR